jgi:hypothetical protein
MCQKGMGVAIGIVLLMACGGRAKDETRLSESLPTQIGIGAERPTPHAEQPTPDAGPGSGGFEGCEVSLFRCSGSLLELCSSGGAWRSVQQCAAPGLCDPERGACLAATCRPGEMRCDGSELQRCNADGTDFETFERCGTAAICELSIGSTSCFSIGCVPGEMHCVGATLWRCNDGQTGFETAEVCATPALCEIGLRSGPCATGCARGETHCIGLALVRCNEGRTDYETVEVCPTACDPGLGCVSADAGAADSPAPG